MDYVHVNSVDIDPADGNFVVSMRHQYSVFKFDRKTGEIIWTLSGLNDDFGLKPDEKFIGQHYAYYEKEDVAGNTSTLTVFDNHTNFGKNFTRMAEITFNGAENAVEKKTYYNGSDLDALSKELGVPDLNLIHEGVQHWATHCGSVEKQAADSMVMGWGLHGKYSNISFTSTVPVFTEYNPQTKKLTFELYATRNPQMQSHEGFFSYRTYKNKN